MSKQIKPGMMCFVNSQCDIVENVGLIVEAMILTTHPLKPNGDSVWLVNPQQPMVGWIGGRKARWPAGRPGYAKPSHLTPIDPDKTVNQSEVNELYSTIPEVVL